MAMVKVNGAKRSVSGHCRIAQMIDQKRVQTHESAEHAHGTCRGSWESASARGGVTFCSCYCHPPRQDASTDTPEQGDAMAPKTTKNQISRGNASRQAARQRATVADFAAKLEEVKNRTAEAITLTPKEPSEAAADPTPNQSKHPEEDEVATATKEKKDKQSDVTVVFTVDGKPVGASQNRLSSISRVTATADAPRWPAGQFRDWLTKQGITNPNHDAPWEVELPNGRKVGAITQAAARLRSKRAADKKAG